MIYHQENISTPTIGTEEDTVGVFPGKAFWLQGEWGEEKEKEVYKEVG